MAVKRIGVLTGGGDVPGLNSAIKGIVEAGIIEGYEILGICRGWEGLTHINFDDPDSVARYTMALDRHNTRTIDRTGGTILHTSRTNPTKMKSLPDHLHGIDFPTRESSNSVLYDVTEHVLRNVEVLEIDCLITIGGDDTLSFSSLINRKGVPIVAIPKTMDNDVRNTEYCLGFATAITRAVDAIQRQRSTVASHERIGIFRVFGRDAGYTSLYTAMVTAIRCAIPEFTFNLDKMIDLVMEDKRNNSSRYSLVVLSEGATWEDYYLGEYGEPDAYGHRKKRNVGEDFGAEVRERTGEETVISDLTYELRSGEAGFIDKMVATTFGNMAVECIRDKKTGLMTAIQNGCYAMVEIPDPKMGPRHIDVFTMFDTERYRPSYANKAGLPLFLTKA
jgi:6-phosphofructokinase 1